MNDSDFDVVVIGGGTYLLIRWHTQNFAYKCPKCGHEFEISATINLTSPNAINRKYLRCPDCNGKGWTKAMKKVKE